MDWGTHLVISPKHKGKSDAIEFHHVFPKAYMRRERPELDNRSVDDIANLAFIGAKTNKTISDGSPREYSSAFHAADLAMQLVVLNSSCDVASKFEKFVERRRKAMALELNAFLDLSG